MTDTDRSAVLKQIGITQWTLRDALADERPGSDAMSEKAEGAMPVPESAHPSAQAPPLQQTPPAKAHIPAAPEQKPASPKSIAVQTLTSLRSKVEQCTACKLSESRTRTVFGSGPGQSDWLFVGEAPGQQEDRQGKPFVGRAGSLLTRMLLALGQEREQVFIANTLKCRPPGNRDPLPEELQACEPFLLKQIELIKPKVMVALGRISAQALLNSDQPLGKLRGQVYRYGPDNIPLIVTYHPAYLLRKPADKAKVWEDLLLANRQLPG